MDAKTTKKKPMSNKQQTAVEWLVSELRESKDFHRVINDINQRSTSVRDVIAEAKEMEKEQIGYSKEDVLTAGEMGEINTYDTKHIVSYLDEAKQFNETYGDK
jgi:hypothetical protein